MARKVIDNDNLGDLWGQVKSLVDDRSDKKVDKVQGKWLSANDYTNEDKNKLDGIETGAKVNVQPDWSQTDNSQDDFIKHKPSIPSKTSDLTNDSNFAVDANYTHTDNNFTNTDKEDVAKIDALETNQTQILSDIEDLEHSISTTSTATGNPISISDSAHVNAEGLTVELEPIQDLHGFDKPWVGGAGKNRLYIAPYTYTTDDVVFEIDSSGVGHLTGSLTNKENHGFKVVGSQPLKAGTYILNGGNANGALLYLTDTFDKIIASTRDSDSQFTLEVDTNVRLYIFVYLNHGSYNEVLHPMIRLATETDPTFEPYSNICPISGYDDTSVVVKDTAENPTVTDTYTLQFGDTVYGAEVDFVSGVATVTHGYIAEYAGETLPSTWISDRDVYASGTTPTTGAQVAYKLASPQTIQLTPQQIKMLKGNNVLVADGDMELVYQVDSVVGDVKEWAEEEFIHKNSTENYSTDEQVIGTWIDGEPLYQKTVVLSLTNATGWRKINHGIADIDTLCGTDGIITFLSGSTADLNYIVPDDLTSSVAYSAQKETIDLYTGTSRSGATVTITFRYTKTAD